MVRPAAGRTQHRAGLRGFAAHHASSADVCRLRHCGGDHVAADYYDPTDFGEIIFMDIQQELDAIRLQLLAGKERMDSFHQLIEDNRAAHEANAKALEENTALTKEIKEILEFGKTFFTMMRYIGVAAKWIAAIGTAIAAIYALFHLNPPPGK